MRILTFGWEFPPAKNGGLGVACYGLTKELVHHGVEVIFVLPRRQPVVGSATFVFADVNYGFSLYPIDSGLTPYQSSQKTVRYFDSENKAWSCSHTMIEATHQFAHQASLIAKREQFDLIHAHDWTSYLAGLAAKIATSKPLVLHVHATSFDQAGVGCVDPSVFEIECRAFREADKIVVLSNYNRDILIGKHKADPAKIVVVPNGCDASEPPRYQPVFEGAKQQDKKIILYHGRITIQKGVDYFVQAARRVVDVYPNVLFVISGSGDMERQIMHQVGKLGLSQHVVFAGALWDEERDRMYQSADLLVMPSVSEPFGLVPLESIRHGTPALISKQSGVAEVLSHVLKVDFWDIEEMADKMIAAIKYGPLNDQLVKEGKKELLKNTWDKAAKKMKQIYYNLIYLLK